MTFKSEKLPLGKYDRRVKLNDVQRDEIKELRKQGLSYAKIAKQYDVSKSLIILVCNPDIAEKDDTSPTKKNGQRQCENIDNIKKNYIRKVRYER